MQPVPNYDYYSEWDKFNVDEELERLDAEEKKSAQKVSEYPQYPKVRQSPPETLWSTQEYTGVPRTVPKSTARSSNPLYCRTSFTVPRIPLGDLSGPLQQFTGP